VAVTPRPEAAGAPGEAAGGVHEIVERFPGLSVLVVGEAMLDCYLEGTSDRLCREAPVPIVTVASRLEAAGAAANTAVNARALGARVRYLSVVGGDAEGEALRAALERAGVETSGLVVDPARRTITKQRVLAGSQLLLRFDQGSTGRLDRDREAALVRGLEAAFAEHDAVVVSDYGYGILTPRVVATLAALQAAAPRVVVVDSKTLPAYRRVGVTAVKPNYDEARRLLGPVETAPGEDRGAPVARHGARLLDLTGAQIAAVTLDTEGALFFERGREPHRTYARPAAQSRAAGAGDTFSAALGLALAAGADLPGAAEIASAAAAVVVGKTGTATCAAADLAGFLASGDKYAPHAGALARRLARYRAEGRRVVLTSGCFDILHRGHIAYLTAAKALGDVLVVALNSDASVRRLKGRERPINPLDDRVHLLAALSAIDHIVAFDEDTPVEVVRVVRPDVFVKGGDYTPERMPEAPVVQALGGSVRILPYVQDRSTTSIIDRIRAAAACPLPLPA
jgi:D-beta-D-heptose 7-phosphate kinase/D-beta-D-heptose 1-phosphate adenosyltransferase